MTQTSFVTQAWLAVNMHRHWTSYYKLSCFRRNWSFPQIMIAIVKGGKRHVKEEEKLHT
jgi:hypothetical protein